MPVHPDIDPKVPSPARAYDYLLGGTENLPVDRNAAEDHLKAHPGVRRLARDHRDFMIRAVHFLADRGIQQFLDLGSGLPTGENVHQVAQHLNPDASVVYVDHDALVLAHGRALLEENDQTAYIDADVRDTTMILKHPDTRRLIDFDRPIGLIAAGLLHHIPDDPVELMALYTDLLMSGSHLVVSHTTSDGADDDLLTDTRAAFPGGQYPRPRTKIKRIYQGWRMAEPGLVDIQRWPEPISSPGSLRILGAVASKR
jgi:hypothetical protein